MQLAEELAKKLSTPHGTLGTPFRTHEIKDDIAFNSTRYIRNITPVPDEFESKLLSTPHGTLGTSLGEG